MTLTLKNLELQNVNSLAGLVEEWARRVFPRSSDELRARIVEAAVAEAREALAAPGAAGMAVMRDEATLGAALGAKLDMDSEHFGLGMGTV